MTTRPSLATLRAAGACVIALSTGARTAAHAAIAPAGQSYQLRVATSFEPSFDDCWTFSPNGRVITAYQSNLGSFPYQTNSLNTVPDSFQAVWRGQISIGFSGGINGATIGGNAVDSRTRTYNFSGSAVGSCAGAVRHPANTGFRTH